nr:hypothetical protein [Micromonospora sp. DSM 115978]
MVFFHFGTAMLLGSGVSFDDLRADYDFGWLDRYPMSEVYALGALGTAACATGVAALVCGAVHRPARRQRPAGVGRRRRAAPRPNLRAPAGFAVLAVSVTTLVAAFVATGGFGQLVGSYAAARPGLSHPLAPYAMFGVSFGLVLAMTGRPGRWRVAALVVFGLFAVFALPLGLRGEVLFPAVAAAAVAGRRRVVVRGVVVLVGVVVLLCLVAGLREIRKDGLAAVDLASVGFNPVSGAAELGASIRPVGAVLDWREGYGEPAAGGATFTGQLSRL